MTPTILVLTKRPCNRPLAKVMGSAGRVEQNRLTRFLKMNRKQFRQCTGVYPETFAEREAVLAKREELWPPSRAQRG